MQKVNIIGPNLPDQSKGSFHVHAAGCADIARKYRGQDGAAASEAVDAVSRVWVAEYIYDNGIMGEDETGRDYLFDFHFAPCVNLPLSVAVV